MADYEYQEVDGLKYSVAVGQRPRKKQPPLLVVMNSNCTSCSGSPVCMTECPVDCIHIMYDAGRPARVYCDTDICIGCMNCFSYDLRPKNVMGLRAPGQTGKGDPQANCEQFNRQDERTKSAVCPWDAIEIHSYDVGIELEQQYYTNPKRLETAPVEGE